MVELPGAPLSASEMRQYRQRRTKLGCGIVIAPLLALAGYAVLSSKTWHPSDMRYPVQGIDVSHHQGEIEWARLPAQGVDFAYIKATEGSDHIDSQFGRNWQAAADAGVRRGAYHYFTLCRSGGDQAINFIKTVPRDPSALPPAIDLEYMGNCAGRPPSANFETDLEVFIALVEAYYQTEVVLYLTKEFDEAYGVSERFDRPLWLRSLVLEPAFGARPWTLWQASNFRRLDGIEGRVDWNVARPDAD